MFEVADDELIKKVAKLLEETDSSHSVDSISELTDNKDEGQTNPPLKKMKADTTIADHDESVAIWLLHNSTAYRTLSLTTSDKQLIEEGKKLNNNHINYAQAMLKLAFPNIEGLQNTLLQDRLKLDVTRSIVQVIHIKGDHWAVLSNISCQDAGNNGICIYDSFYNDIDDHTAKLINNMTHGKIHSSHVHSKQKQEGGRDCGVFTIAIATSLLYNRSSLKFQQPQMRHHLISCFENNSLVPFP